jgi:hypothetical protein
MKIGALTILSRMHCNGTPTDGWLLAGWHPRASITWRWGLDWSPYKPYNDSFFFIKTNGGGIAGFRLPYLGNVSFSTQEFMLDPSVLPVMHQGR